MIDGDRDRAVGRCTLSDSKNDFASSVDEEKGCIRCWSFAKATKFPGFVEMLAYESMHIKSGEENPVGVVKR